MAAFPAACWSLSRGCGAGAPERRVGDGPSAVLWLERTCNPIASPRPVIRSHSVGNCRATTLRRTALRSVIAVRSSTPPINTRRPHDPLQEEQAQAVPRQKVPAGVLALVPVDPVQRPAGGAVDRSLEGPA